MRSFGSERGRLAAGAGLDVARRLQAGEADAGFCAIRPPGHHATAPAAPATEGG
ncbi:MAG: hypothetical protein JJU45_05830 [Acidimicrobiia bacterium]|nr:hypothetical protein [Acidimicrobiia bacterium]